ncbi:acyltransferase [Mycobacterium sp. MS1601]|uniref:acyltransferase family protein n=1 Tax=Mycobacterium sp. MS1601 TaxID=1936029 RepID=UPI00097958BD|nr:acyltransferase family protein [Mycobacterium sp. MS1601]AQA06713.1 acyltransferase [Mycobacterium sp. MS1601]
MTDVPRHSEPARYRPDIEGLRAVAVLAVVLFHAQIPGLDGGFVGVDIFFVISGFLITGLLWRETSTTGTVRLRNFYGARARRLLPAAALVGIITLITSAILLPPLQARSAVGDGIASALYVSNYRFILQGVDYSAPTITPSPFQHYWSLGVEEQFYFVWPVLMIVTAWWIRRRRRQPNDQGSHSPRPYLVVLTLVAVTSFSLSLLASYWAPFVAFFSLPTRAWQLAIGGLIALTATQWHRLPRHTAITLGWTGLTVIALACTQLNETTLYPGIAALLPTLGTALVIGAGCALPTHGCGQLLGLSPMRTLGRLSYSWYLWHWPILILTPLLVGHPLNLPSRCAAAVLSLALAALTLHHVENPLRFAPTIRTSARRSLELGALATAGAVAVGVVLLVAVPAPVGRGTPRTPVTLAAAPVPAGAGTAAYDAAVEWAFAQVHSAVEASADLGAVPSNLQPPLADASAELNDVYLNGCLRSAWQIEQPDCASGDLDSSTTVTVVGDSNSAMWNPAFRALAELRGWRLQMMGKAGCPLMDLPTRSPQLHREYTECSQWRTEVLTRLRAEPPELVVVGMWRQYGYDGYPAGFTAYDRAWLAGLTELVHQLRTTGAQVLVLGPVPDPQSIVPICLSGHLDNATACAPTRSTAVNHTGITAENTATTAAGGHYADLTNLFCTNDTCPVIIGNTLVYLDRNHLTTEYARLLAPAIGALADRALAHTQGGVG